MTGNARRQPWSLVAPIPSATKGGFSKSRRTLYRVLAVALALAARIPLFAEADGDSSRGHPEHQRAQPPHL